MSESQPKRPRVVVGVDGSASSKSALRWARRVAVAEGADIDVVGAWAWPSVMGVAGTPLEYSPQLEIEKELSAAVDEVFGADRPTGLSVRAVEGGAAHVLIEASRDALMVVVGSRGLGGFLALLLGSVSGHVAEHAFCPVLVVHGNKEESQ